MSLKRSRSPENDGNNSSSDDDDFGPALPSSVPPKKKRKLPYEALYVAALPQGLKYSKSLMHKDQLAFVHVAPEPVGFVITASIDGVVKFWKKMADGIEFAKEYKAHEGRVLSASISADGAYYATVGDEEDKSIKVFDVVTFDLLNIISLEQTGSVVSWVNSRGSPPEIAVAIGKEIHLYD